MKKLFLGTVLLAFALAVPVPAMAGVNIGIGISFPPPIGFQAPPDVIVLPDTDDVYVVPDVDADIFFWDGWWWRLWEGRWYRSSYYNRGWAYYNRVPRFYFDVDPGWRRYYRDHDWHGHRWNYERIPDRQLRRNWKIWHNERRWERQGNWGIKNYNPRPQQERQELRRQRREQYQQRPEVQRHQQQMQEQRRQQGQRPPQVRQPQRQEQRPQVQQPQNSRPEVRPERGQEEKQDRRQDDKSR